MTTSTRPPAPTRTGTADRSDPAHPAVRLADLHKSFGDIHAVRGIDLTIETGGVVAILGPNGAGKSTTIDLLLGLAGPDRGNVRLWGGDPARAVRAGRVGAMLQSGALLPDLTVRQLLSLFARLHRHPLAVGEILERADITDIAGRRTTALSGGQAQRVRFALAITPDPDLLVLDEPTTAMDVELRRAFWATMHEFADRGTTVLFATHYLEEADDFADRIVVVSGGRVIADGTGAALKAGIAGRVLTADIPDATAPDLRALPGVAGVEPHGTRMTLRCTDSDTVLRAIVDRYPRARDIEIHAASLEDAFLALTAAQH